MFSAALKCPPSTPRPTGRVLCEDVLEKCEDSYACPNSADVAEVLRLCDIHRTCYVDGEQVSRTNICGDAKFDAFLNRCVPEVAGNNPNASHNYGLFSS